MRLFGTGLNRICAVVAASTAAEMAKLLRSALRQARTVELRLDWLSSDLERERFLAWLKKSKVKSATFLATCRRREGGGKFAGGVDRELYWLIQAREAGCQWCDLELETLRKLPGQSVREYPVPPRVMLSVHDFDRTPDLPRTMNPPAHGGVDAVKIAAEARSIHDSVRLLRLARSSKNFVAVPMGETGLPARILALREGSALAYAPVAAATAPGQVSLDDMKHLYRAHALTRRTGVYGVVGKPVGHSLSPLLHNAGFVARRMDAVYLPFLVHDLRDFLAAVPDFGVRGFSVTHPHKQAILKYLKECDPLAAEIGAVNTVVVRRDGSLYGSNTDYLGLLRALEVVNGKHNPQRHGIFPNRLAGKFAQGLDFEIAPLAAGLASLNEPVEFAVDAAGKFAAALAASASGEKCGSRKFTFLEPGEEPRSLCVAGQPVKAQLDSPGLPQGEANQF